MTETFLENYFKTLATRSVFVAHTEASPTFFRVQSKVDLAEFDNAVRNIKKDICLILETGSGELEITDNPRDFCRIGIHILIKSTNEFNAVKEARDRAKYILLSIVSVMRRDSKPIYEYSDSQAGPLNAAGIVLQNMGKYDDMDGVDGNWYGKVIYFDFRAPVSQAYNPDDWIS